MPLPAQLPSRLFQARQDLNLQQPRPRKAQIYRGKVSHYPKRSDSAVQFGLRALPASLYLVKYLDAYGGNLAARLITYLVPPLPPPE